MKTIKELKSAARQSLSGKWGSSAVLCGLVLFLVFVVWPLLVLNLYAELCYIDWLIDSPLPYVIMMMLLLPFYWGFVVTFLNVARGNSCNVGDLFHCLDDYVRILVTMLLRTVYLILWTNLLIIGGIIKYYSYALTPYILNDNPDLRYNGAIDKSMAMMKGHKKDLFLLDLYSIGWIIIGYGLICLLNQFLFEHKIRDMIFTFILPPIFISLFWLIPYWKTARAHFYLDLKAQQEQTSVEGV